MRRFVADRVKAYAPGAESVFDGACGSGQMEEFLGISDVYGVDVQAEALEAFRENFPEGEGFEGSFFIFDKDLVQDITVMNPPFSMKFKDLTEEEKGRIREDFPRKRSGVVDDVFYLKGLEFCKRFAFYIGFPGICYRKAERTFREEVGTGLAELTTIKKGFDDTHIDVIFFVIDKEKSSKEVRRVVYDCSSEKALLEETGELDLEGFRWEIPAVVEEKEAIDIEKVNREADLNLIAGLRRQLEFDRIIVDVFEDISPLEFMATLEGLEKVVDEFKERLLEKIGKRP